MKKGIQFVGIVLIVIGVLCFLIGGLFIFAAKNTLDASFDHYAMQYRMAGIFLVSGAVVLFLGIAVLVYRKKVLKR